MQYRSRFDARVANLVGTSAAERITGYAAIFDEASANDLLCLCGAVASDWRSVGEASHAGVTEFFADQVSWIRAQLESGAASGEFPQNIDAELVATAVFASLEGSMLMARAGQQKNLASLIGTVVLGLISTSSNR
jgi:TetR/AcrR family transcriptional regulator, transcriptional repressor for nem operon